MTQSIDRTRTLAYLVLCGKTGCIPKELKSLLSIDHFKAAQCLHRLWLNGDVDRRMGDFTTTRYWSRGMVPVDYPSVVTGKPK